MRDRKWRQGATGSRLSGWWAGAVVLAIAGCGDISTTAAADQCPPGAARRVFNLTGYNANITTRPNSSGVKRGQLVEFNPNSIRDHAGYLRSVAQRGGLPEWYWVGVNCEKGPDCARLSSAGVQLESTGTPEWNLTEARIRDLKHPDVILRAEREMERALRAASQAGTDLAFRIDNMHDLNDPRFYDHEHHRSFEELSILTRAWDRVVARLREAGVLQREALVGLTAHNNFAFWTDWIARKGTPPLVLRMENPTQFKTDFDTGAELMRARGIPFIAIEFRNGHRYRPSSNQLAAIAARVSLMVLMADEDNYEDGVATAGPGPRVIVGQACSGR